MGERNDLIDSVIDASADQRDQWFAERGVTTDRAKWKARALAAESIIASLSEALAEAEKKGAEVKPLEWAKPTDRPDEDEVALWTSHGLGGRYSISEEQSLHMGGRGHLLWWAHDGFQFSEFRTVEEAKAAAQADFANRVLACLAPPRDLSQGGQHG